MLLASSEIRDASKHLQGAGKLYIRNDPFRTSLVAQCLELHSPNTGGLGSTPRRGTRSYAPQQKIPHASTKPGCSQMNK